MRAISCCIVSFPPTAEPVSSLKRQNSTPAAGLSPSKRAALARSSSDASTSSAVAYKPVPLPFKSPRKAPRRVVGSTSSSSAPPMLDSSQEDPLPSSSQEETVEGFSLLSFGGGGPAYKASPATSAEEVKEEHLRGVCRRMSVYGADVGQNGARPPPPLVGRGAEADADVDRFFLRTAGSYLSEEGLLRGGSSSDGEEGDPDDSYKWRWVSVLLGRAAGTRLDRGTFRRLMKDGVLRHENKVRENY